MSVIFQNCHHQISSQVSSQKSCNICNNCLAGFVKLVYLIRNQEVQGSIPDTPPFLTRNSLSCLLGLVHSINESIEEGEIRISFLILIQIFHLQNNQHLWTSSFYEQWKVAWFQILALNGWWLEHLRKNGKKWAKQKSLTWQKILTNTFPTL